MFEPYTAMAGEKEAPALFVSLLLVDQVSPYAIAAKSSRNMTTVMNI
jgi:hypothetical protein